MSRRRRLPPAAAGARPGFTLIELMISLVLFSFAIAGVLSVAVSLTQGFREQRLSVAAEGAVRGPLDFLADAIRQASPGVPDPSKVTDTVLSGCPTGAIATVDGGTSASDELDLIFASGGVATNVTAAFDGTSGTITVADESEFSSGDSVLVTNSSEGALYKISGVASNTLTVNSTSCTVPSFPKGAVAIRATHAHFKVGTIDGVPTLLMSVDGGTTYEPLAEGIEDLQVALGLDTDSDEKIDSWVNDASFTSASTGTPHAVRLSLISIATSPLTGNYKPYYRPAAENHADSSATPDAYRRRVLRSTVEMRNIGGSP